MVAELKARRGRASRASLGVSSLSRTPCIELRIVAPEVFAIRRGYLWLMYVKNRSGAATTGGRHQGVRTVHLQASCTFCSSPARMYSRSPFARVDGCGHTSQTLWPASLSSSHWVRLNVSPFRCRVPGGLIRLSCASEIRYLCLVASVIAK